MPLATDCFMIKSIEILTSFWPDYELLDFGGGKKLERFGKYTLIREEPRAWLSPAHPELWPRADAEHDQKSGWRFRHPLPREWTITYDKLALECRLTAKSKHVGIFPEQVAHWTWLAQHCAGAKILNLFGYTGVSSLVAASAGAEVTHVDGAKGVVDWARHNQELSGLQDKPIRWIVDDVAKFVGREVKRGKKYDAIIMDPPTFGRGPGKELWRVETHLLPLLQDCRKILSSQPKFFLISMYAIDQSSLLLADLLGETLGGLGGAVIPAELALSPTGSLRRLPMSITARWTGQLA